MNLFSVSPIQDTFSIQYILVVLRSTDSVINVSNSRKTRLQIIPVVQDGNEDDGTCLKQAALFKRMNPVRSSQFIYSLVNKYINKFLSFLQHSFHKINIALNKDFASVIK